jgi:soluble lytic murein transglycosylase-like protein
MAFLNPNPTLPVPPVDPFTIAKAQALAALTGQRPPQRALTNRLPTSTQTPPQQQQATPAPAPGPAPGSTPNYGDQMRAAMQQLQNALGSQQQFEQNTPPPQMKQATLQRGNPWGDAIAGLAALFAPSIGAGVGSQMRARDTQYDQDYQREQQANQAQFDASSQTYKTRETALENQVNVAEKNVDALDRLQQTQQKDEWAHSIGQQRADAYAQNVLLQHSDRESRNAETIKRDRDNALYHAQQVGVANKRLAVELETTKWRVAGQLQAAGIRSATAIQLGNQRQSMALVLERLREMNANARENQRDQIRVQIGAMQHGLSSYDALLRAASVPGARPQVVQAAIAALQPNSPYNKLLAQANSLGVTAPSYDVNQSIQDAQQSGYEEALANPATAGMVGTEIPGATGAQGLGTTVNVNLSPTSGYQMGPGGTPQALPPTSAPPTAPQNLVSLYGSTVNEATQKTGISPTWVYALMQNEDASGDPRAKSSAGALGPMQLMPATAKALGVDPNDPRQNIIGGSRYFMQMLLRFGDPLLAAAAYNAGPEAVEKAGGIPNIPETQAYVANFARNAGIPYSAAPTNAAPPPPAKPAQSGKQDVSRTPQPTGPLDTQTISVAKKLYQQFGGGDAGWNHVVSLIRKYAPQLKPADIERYRAQITGAAAGAKSMGWGTL